MDGEREGNTRVKEDTDEEMVSHSVGKRRDMDKGKERHTWKAEDKDGKEESKTRVRKNNHEQRGMSRHTQTDKWK